LRHQLGPGLETTVSPETERKEQQAYGERAQDDRDDGGVRTGQRLDGGDE
jgi:hypothetical protein